MKTGGAENMNEKKIAFIICVNDMSAYAECRYYQEAYVFK